MSSLKYQVKAAHKSQWGGEWLEGESEAKKHSKEG